MMIYKTIALDIETIPDMDMVKNLPNVEPHKGLKDPEKIKANIDAKRKEQIEKMALNPFTGRICAFAVAGDENFEYSIPDMDGEYQILEKIASYIDYGYSPIVTFNGYQFDIPYIYRRLMVHRIAPPRHYAEYMRRHENDRIHVDLRMVFSNWDKNAAGTLSYYGKLIFGEDHEDLDYAAFPQMIRDGRGGEIAAGCAVHAGLTMRLYEYCQGYLV